MAAIGEAMTRPFSSPVMTRAESSLHTIELMGEVPCVRIMLTSLAGLRGSPHAPDHTHTLPQLVPTQRKFSLGENLRHVTAPSWSLLVSTCRKRVLSREKLYAPPVLAPKTRKRDDAAAHVYLMRPCDLPWPIAASMLSSVRRCTNR